MHLSFQKRVLQAQLHCQTVYGVCLPCPPQMNKFSKYHPRYFMVLVMCTPHTLDISQESRSHVRYTWDLVLFRPPFFHFFLTILQHVTFPTSTMKRFHGTKSCGERDKTNQTKRYTYKQQKMRRRLSKVPAEREMCCWCVRYRCSNTYTCICAGNP